MKAIKNSFVLLFSAMAIYSCTRAQDDNAQPEVNSPKDVLTPEARKDAARDWQQFYVKSVDEIAVIQKRIDKIRTNIYLATVKDKVKIRRVMNKAEFKLTKLDIRLDEQNHQFHEKIETFTEADLKKIERIKTEFRKDINNVIAWINACQCESVEQNKDLNQTDGNGG